MVIGCLMACMICPAVFAQEEASTAEIFGGLSLLRRSEGGLTGWGGSIAFNVGSSLAVKADISGQYSKFENIDDSRVGQHNFLGGLQYTKRYESVNIFAEALAGVATISERAGSVSGTTNAFAAAFGGGLDWKFSPNFGWRVAQIDYMPLRANGNTINGFRFQTGILIPLGK